MSGPREQTVEPYARQPRQWRARALNAAISIPGIPRLKFGRLTIGLPSGDRLVLDGRQAGPHASLTIHRWRCLSRILAGAGIGFADSYIAGDWSTPNLMQLLDILARNRPDGRPWRLPQPVLKFRHALNRNTRLGSRRNIAAHYELGNAFYGKWLDAGMSYSAAMFTSAGQTLEDAQDAKLDRIVKLLDTQPGDRILEIGCGWGPLVERLASHEHCCVTGITLSKRQLEYAQQLVQGLQPYPELRLQDYRDVNERYDRIVSIEMLEAVGEAYWPVYFQKLWDSLRPGGIAVLQVITIDEGRFAAYRRRPDFIQTHIFPGGMLPTKPVLRQQIDKAGLRLASSESFGQGYALTLAAWQRRFERAWPEIETLGFDARFKRAWEYYFAYCKAGFETGCVDVGLYKIERPAGDQPGKEVS
jgi:cyclopropane-fatty-acyl-phospholipid synthase